MAELDIRMPGLTSRPSLVQDGAAQGARTHYQKSFDMDVLSEADDFLDIIWRIKTINVSASLEYTDGFTDSISLGDTGKTRIAAPANLKALMPTMNGFSVFISNYVDDFTNFFELLVQIGGPNFSTASRVWAPFILIDAKYLEPYDAGGFYDYYTRAWSKTDGNGASQGTMSVFGNPITLYDQSGPDVDGYLAISSASVVAASSFT